MEYSPSEIQTRVRIEETTEVVSLCAFPSGGQLLATYSDGTARVWNLKHPRKSESHIVASQLPRDQSTVGILEGGVAWGRSPTAFTIMSLAQDGELRREAQYPIKTAYRLASPRDADLIVVEDKANGQERVLILDLEQQGIVSTVAARSVTLCVALGQDAVVLNDVASGLRVVGTEARDGKSAKTVEGGMVTCLSSMEIQESVHMIAWGEKDGTTQVCTVDLRGGQCVVRRMLAHRLHQEAVTAVTFLDDTRIASGGQDRSIIISRIDAQGDSPFDIMERRLQLTLQCKGMRITGLKGPAEQQKLSELIAKSEREVTGTG